MPWICPRCGNSHSDMMFTCSCTAPTVTDPSGPVSFAYRDTFDTLSERVDELAERVRKLENYDNTEAPNDSRPPPTPTPSAGMDKTP